MKNILLVIIINLLLLYSCTPDRFLIKRPNENLIDGYIIGNLDSVDVKSDNSIIIQGDSKVAMRVVQISEPHYDLTLELIRGEGAEFIFKTAIDKFEVHPNLKFNLTTNGSELFENNNLISKVDSIKLIEKSQGRLHIRNHGNRYLITYNCDTLKYGYTSVENSEFLIIKPINKSKIKLRNIYIEQEDDIESNFEIEKK